MYKSLYAYRSLLLLRHLSERAGSSGIRHTSAHDRNGNARLIGRFLMTQTKGRFQGNWSGCSKRTLSGIFFLTPKTATVLHLSRPRRGTNTQLPSDSATERLRRPMA